MSVLETVVVVPSRVWAVYHYLLTTEGQREKRATLESRLSPVALQRKNKKGEANIAMLKSVIRTTLNMGLVIEEDGGDVLKLNPALPAEARRRTATRENFPRTLYDLFFQSQYTANHPLGKAMAWHLTQDPFEMKSWSELQSDLTLRHLLDGSATPDDNDDDEPDRTEGERKVGVNDVRWFQLIYWSTFLGFAWEQRAGKNDVLIPDPTVFLRSRLPEIFKAHNKKTLPLSVVLKELSTICPMFDDGTIRTEVEKITGTRDPQTMSRSSAFALLRLQQEGLIELTKESDADVWHLPELDEMSNFSRMTWLERKSEDGQ